MNEITLYFKSFAGAKNELPRSDTIFGAICWGLWFIYGEDILLQFLSSYLEGSPPLIISSTFPFINLNGNQIIHLFPKPKLVVMDPQKTESLYKKSKDFNKAQYVDHMLFQEIIDNRLTDETLFRKLINNELIQSKDLKILSRTSIDHFPVKFIDIPKNAVDRINGGTIEGKLYHVREGKVDSKNGVFMLCKVADEWINKILTIFQFYSDKGLGGDSSVGKGCYVLDVKRGFPIKEASEGKRWVSLSLFYPGNEEWYYFKNNIDEAWYSITKRKGKIESSFYTEKDVWEKSLLMFEEGSVFPIIIGKKFYGKLIEVKELENGKSIFRYGIAFPIRMR